MCIVESLIPIYDFFNTVLEKDIHITQLIKIQYSKIILSCCLETNKKTHLCGLNASITYFMSGENLNLKKKLILYKITANFSQCIEWFVKDQVFFLRLYDSAPRPPSSPLSRQQVVSLSRSSSVSSGKLTDERGVGGGRGAKLYDSENAWSSINHLKLSVKLIVQMHHPVPCTFY